MLTTTALNQLSRAINNDEEVLKVGSNSINSSWAFCLFGIELYNPTIDHPSKKTEHPS